MGPPRKTSNASATRQDKPTRKLRSACDMCHQTKVKCTGSPRCEECIKLGIACRFSLSNRIGRPKGARNKSTLDRIRSYEANENPQESNNTSELNEAPKATNASPSEFSFPSKPVTEMQWTNLNPFSFEGPTPSADLQDEPMSAFTETQLPLEDNLMTLLPSDFNTNPWDFSPDMSVTTSDSGATSTFSPSTPAAQQSDQQCNCLQTHAQLLCRMKTLHRNQGQQALPMETLMFFANQVLECFSTLLNCPSCLNTSDREIFLLSAMNIRTIVRDFGDLIQHMEEQKSLSLPHSPTIAHQPPNYMAPSSHGSVSSVDEVLPNPFSSRGYGSLMEDSADPVIVSPTVGNFQIKGSDGQVVVEFLITRTLGKIRAMIERVKQRCDLTLAMSPAPSYCSARSNSASSTSPNMADNIYNPQYPAAFDFAGSIDINDAVSPDLEHLKTQMTGVQGTIDKLTQKLQISHS